MDLAAAPPVPFRVEEQAQRLVLSTDALTVEIDRETAALVVPRS